MSLSLHILKRDVVFPPAPHEICKRDQKHSFFHDEGEVTFSANFSGGCLAALHTGTPESRVSACAHLAGIPACLPFWHARGQEGTSSKPLHKQVLAKSHFLVAFRPLADEAWEMGPAQ